MRNSPMLTKYTPIQSERECAAETSAIHKRLSTSSFIKGRGEVAKHISSTSDECRKDEEHNINYDGVH